MMPRLPHVRTQKMLKWLLPYRSQIFPQRQEDTKPAAQLVSTTCHQLEQQTHRFNSELRDCHFAEFVQAHLAIRYTMTS